MNLNNLLGTGNIEETPFKEIQEMPPDQLKTFEDNLRSELINVINTPPPPTDITASRLRSNRLQNFQTLLQHLNDDEGIQMSTINEMQRLLSPNSPNNSNIPFNSNSNLNSNSNYYRPTNNGSNQLGNQFGNQFGNRAAIIPYRGGRRRRTRHKRRKSKRNSRSKRRSRRRR